MEPLKIKVDSRAVNLMLIAQEHPNKSEIHVELVGWVARIVRLPDGRLEFSRVD